MTVDITTDIVINRPVAKVFAFSSNPDNVPAWYKNISSVEWLSDKPVKVGTRVAYVAQFLGKTLSYTYEVIALEPESVLIMRTSEGPFPMETQYTWEAVDSNSTLIKLRNRGVPSGFSRWMAPFMSMAIRKANRKDLALLKSVLEK